MGALKKFVQPTVAPRRALTAYLTDAAASALDALETAMGGRATLVDVVLHAPTHTGLDRVVALLADPRNDARALSLLCREASISVGELLEAYKQGRLARAQVHAIDLVATHLPAVVEDLLLRAQPHTVDCGKCHGTGTMTGEDAPPAPCDACAATGKRTILPDLDRQKVALDLAQMSPKGKGPVVVVNQHAAPSMDASPEGFDILLQMADRVLHGTRKTIDVEGKPVPDDPPAPESS